MDIYRPSSTESDGLLPVFVYLHGGKFESGSCSAGIYNGRILASAMDAVVVCINYRLGKNLLVGRKNISELKYAIDAIRR